MTDSDHEAEVKRRMRMPYHRVISGDPVEGSLGEVADLPGCLAAGETPADALANLDEAMAAEFEAALMTGMRTPDPAAGARVLLSA